MLFGIISKTIRLLSQRSTYALLGAFLIHLTLGNKYTLSNVNTYLTSYMRRHGSPRATYGNSIWFSTCYSIGQPTSMVIGGYLERKFSTRLTCFLGCALYSISIILTSYSVDYGFLMALLTYSLIPGLGCGLAYMTPMSNGFGWFPDRRGLVAGGILAGLGLGPFVFNMIQTNFVNPHNLSPDPAENGYFTQSSILDRVPKLFVFMGCIYGLMQLIGCSLLFEPPANQDIKPDAKAQLQPQSTKANFKRRYNGTNNESKSDLSLTVIPTISRKISIGAEQNILGPIDKRTSPTRTIVSNYEKLLVKQTVRTPEFIVLFLAFGFITQGMLFVNSMLKKYGQTFIMDDNFLAQAGSIGSIANCLGRVVWGMAIDRFTFRSCLAASSLIFSLGSLLIPFEFILRSKALFVCITITLFGSLSGWVCIFPVHISRVFGRTNGSIVYGLVYLAQPAISILISPAIQYLIDNTSRFIPFYCILGLNLLGLLIYLLSYPKETNQTSVDDINLDNIN